MKTYTDYKTLVTAERENRANHHTMLSCVMPRPIAFVSTISREGVRNIAPFSFFNGVGSNPPAVVFSPATKADGTDKDTIHNLRSVPEAVVNVVPFAIRDAMNQASFAYAPDIDEFKVAGFTPVPSKCVKPPRIGESPVQLECRLVDIVKVGGGPLSANICICEIVCFHIAEEMALDNGTVDVEKIDLVGRMGGDWYSRITNRFELPKPSGP
jgi:flavin reductase (DIM6/NTAB) family NADH-FMN oxidoreductase RutF